MQSLAKWDVLHVFPPGVGHGKFAVCICPRRLWFMYVNSDKPKGRKRAEIAILLSPHEALFIRKACFLDTTEFPDISQMVVNAALAEVGNCLGPLPPFIRQAVVATVRNYGVLEPERREAVLAGEP